LACTSASAANFQDVCKTGTPQQVKAMIDSGADVNAKDERGCTPLMFAAEYNSNADMIEALIKAGADLHAKDQLGHTPLMYAAMLNHNPKVIAVLFKAGADVNAQDKNGKTALDYARQNNNAKALEALTNVGTQGK
jgi:ankyrin repeat protein